MLTDSGILSLPNCNPNVEAAEILKKTDPTVSLAMHGVMTIKVPVYSAIGQAEPETPTNP